MGNGPLERQHWRQIMHMRGIGRSEICCLETKVIVPVRLLRCAAWMNQIYLRRHLIIRSQPRLGRRRYWVIGEIPQEHLWRTFT